MWLSNTNYSNRQPPEGLNVLLLLMSTTLSNHAHQQGLSFVHLGLLGAIYVWEIKQLKSGTQPVPFSCNKLRNIRKDATDS